MLKLNTRYMRTSPLGDSVPVIPKTTEEVTYQESFIEEGYTFAEVEEVAPRGNVCIACE